MSCMVCRKSDVRLFNVGSNYGKINHTVGDDFNEIYGEKVKIYLTPDSCVCNVCMNILDNVAKLIRCIWNVISDPYSQPQPSKLSKFWKIFASLKLEGDDIEESQIQESVNRIPTPNLMVQAFSVPYNPKLEVQIAEKNRQDRASHLSSVNTNTDENESESEVEKIFNRKKKEGHNWPRKKGGGATRRGKARLVPSSVKSRYRKDKRDADTPYSEYSTSSSYTKRRFRSLSSPRTSTICTRSLSRAQAEEENNECNFYCKIRNCNMFSDDIDELNVHNIEEHNMPLIYHCFECSNVYTTDHLLNIHMKYHSFTFFCLMCGMEQESAVQLQNHLDEHMIYSVQCKYCDKSFLSKSIREEHITKNHRGRRTKRIFKNKLILDRIDKSHSEQEQHDEDENGYEARYIFYTDMVCEKDDVDMTIENLKLKNIPVYTDEGITTEEVNHEETERTYTETTQIANIDVEEESPREVEENVATEDT